MFDWDDLKAFLAVARSGSTLGAAKALGVNQTTAARRLEALEAAVGVKLFERGPAGRRLTEVGRDLLAQAEKVEAGAAGFASRAQAHQRGLSGAIRLTCTELWANVAITPAIAAFRKLHPEVQIDLVVTDEALDLEAGEADLALRSGRTLPLSDLVARRIIDHEFALYCSRDYASRRGSPRTPAELAEHDLIGGETVAGQLPGVAWMLAAAGGKAPVVTLNSMSNLLHAVRAGLGVAPLGCILGDADPRLIRCSEAIVEAQAYSWLVTRRALLSSPRVRAFVDFLVPHIQQEVRTRRARNRLLRERWAEQAVSAPELPA